MLHFLGLLVWILSVGAGAVFDSAAFFWNPFLLVPLYFVGFCGYSVLLISEDPELGTQ